jgi:hypothetical protein
MPRYAAANLAAIDPEFRKVNNIGSSNSNKPGRYAYGKDDRVLVAAGRELLENGLCLRFLPVVDSTKQLTEFRTGRNNAAFGDWGYLWVSAHWVGNPGICFNIHDGNPEVSLYDSPLHVLRKTAYDSIGDHPHPTLAGLFSDLLSKNFVRNSHVGSLKRPEETMFISASIVERDEHGEVVLSAFSEDPRKNARVIGLKKSAAQALYSALSVRDKATGDFAVDDMLSLGGAKLFSIVPERYQSGQENQVGVGREGPVTFQCPSYARDPSGSGKYVVGYPGSRSDMTHFGVIHEYYDGKEISLEDKAEQIVQEAKSLDDYLYLPTYEEQAAMLAPVFPREALDYAWREFPEYLKTLPRGTTTHVVPEIAAQQSQRQEQPATSDPMAEAPWVTGATQEDEDVVGDMFSAQAEVPAGASTAPPAPPKASGGKASSSHADILARARAAAKGSK